VQPGVLLSIYIYNEFSMRGNFGYMYHLWSWQIVCRKCDTTSFMYMYSWFVFFIDDFWCVRGEHRHVLDGSMRRRQFMFRRCSTTSGVWVRSGLRLDFNKLDVVCRYQCHLLELFSGQFLRWWQRAASGMPARHMVRHGNRCPTIVSRGLLRVVGFTNTVRLQWGMHRAWRKVLSRWQYFFTRACVPRGILLCWQRRAARSLRSAWVFLWTRLRFSDAVCRGICRLGERSHRVGLQRRLRVQPRQILSGW
jgi:hypothetical protein